MESRFQEGPTGHRTFTDIKREEITAAASLGRDALESLALGVE